VARGLGDAGDPRGAATLTELAGDPDPEVVAAAFTALGATGCPPPAAARAAAALPGSARPGHPNWRIREAAAKALAAAAADPATAPLLAALSDPNLDVRKAAVRALGQLSPAHRDVPTALRRAGEDPDADVRAYARQALSHYQPER
jgi:HEAT repeat protein